ncbi:hypothetical protein EDB84DRAFT_1487008, partial [Lactarius hengduanensis]
IYYTADGQRERSAKLIKLRVRNANGMIEKEYIKVEGIRHYPWPPSPLRCMNDWNISIVTPPAPIRPPLPSPAPSMVVAPPNAPKPAPVSPRPMRAPVFVSFPPLPNPAPCRPKSPERSSPPFAPVLISPPPRPAPTPAPRPPLSARCTSGRARC